MVYFNANYNKHVIPWEKLMANTIQQVPSNVLLWSLVYGANNSCSDRIYYKRFGPVVKNALKCSLSQQCSTKVFANSCDSMHLGIIMIIIRQTGRGFYNTAMSLSILCQWLRVKNSTRPLLLQCQHCNNLSNIGPRHFRQNYFSWIVWILTRTQLAIMGNPNLNSEFCGCVNKTRNTDYLYISQLYLFKIYAEVGVVDSQRVARMGRSE